MTRDSLVCVAVMAPIACGSHPVGDHIALPDGSIGIGFDDLRYSPSLHRVLVPAGRSGRVDLVNPDTLDVWSITGFGTQTAFSGSHDDGPTTIDESPGFLYVTDRTLRRLVAVPITHVHQWPSIPDHC
jgi:hypothetical protein